MTIHKIEITRPSPEIVRLEFVDLPRNPCHLESLPVSWRILNSDKIPTNTEIYYSFDNSISLNNRINSAPADGDYQSGDILYSLIPFRGSVGPVYVQARAIIDNNVYFSNILSLYVRTCQSTCFPKWKIDPNTPNNKITDVYIEFGTYNTPDRIQVLGNYNQDNCTGNILYDTGCTGTLSNSSIYPPSSGTQYANDSALYLNSNNLLSDKPLLWSTGIWHDCFSIHESDLPLGIKNISNCSDTSSSSYSVYVLGPDFNLFESGSSRSQYESCVDVKTSLAEIHYTTYDTRDEIIVFSKGTSNPCDGPISVSSILWRSGCVGTGKGEGPGVLGGHYGIFGGKKDSFRYSESDKPFYISVLPDCEDTKETNWCVTVYYDNKETAWSA